MVVWSRAMTWLLSGILGGQIASHPSYCGRCWLITAVAPAGITAQTINPGGLGGAGQRAEPCLLSEIGSEPTRAFNRVSRASGFEEVLTWEVGT
jgi:hypothetical protein